MGIFDFYYSDHSQYFQSLPTCKAWLMEHHLAIFNEHYPAEAKTVSALSSDFDKLDLDSSVGALNATSMDHPTALELPLSMPALHAVTKKVDKSKSITVKRVERNKRKHVIHVNGLELFDIDLKKAAKLFAGKFACGSSVTKNPQGNDEIVVQGDVQDQLVSLILQTWPSSIPSSKHITILESKKSKKEDLAA